MQKVSEQIGIDKVSLLKVLNFLPYPFLVSEFRNHAQHNIFVNQKFLDEIGYTCKDIPTLNDWFTMAYPDKHYRNEIILDWSNRLQAAQEAGEDSVVKKARIQTKNHGLKWYEVKASVLGQINFVAFVNIDEDIKKEQELERLNQNKDRTLSILSHDLRTPLANIYSVLQLLNNGQLTERETNETFYQLSSQVFRMLEFLDTTLQWSKINFTQIQNRPDHIDIDVLVLRIMEIYKASYMTKGIKVTTDLRGDIPLRCDPDILSILFRNIFSNAVKFTPEGGNIIVRNAIRDDRTVLEVENTGPTITQERIEMILSNNYDSQRGTMGEKGLGLGLKLCQQLLKSVGGKLKIQSISPTSTAFTIVL